MGAEFESLSEALIPFLHSCQLRKLKTELGTETDLQPRVPFRPQPEIQLIIFKWLFQIL